MKNEKMMDPTRGQMGLKNANEVVKPRKSSDISKGSMPSNHPVVKRS